MCAEKFHCAPEEKPQVTMRTIWDLVVLAEEEAERMEKLNSGN